MSVLDIFRPRWKHSDHTIREAAVASISSPSILGAIIRRETDDKIRGIAVSRLSSDVKQLLAEPYGMDRNNKLTPFIQALGEARHPSVASLLRDLSVDGAQGVSLPAVHHLAFLDPSVSTQLLRDVFVNGGDYKVRLFALDQCAQRGADDFPRNVFQRLAEHLQMNMQYDDAARMYARAGSVAPPRPQEVDVSYDRETHTFTITVDGKKTYLSFTPGEWMSKDKRDQITKLPTEARRRIAEISQRGL
jgi:hypothetical protein